MNYARTKRTLLENMLALIALELNHAWCAAMVAL
jgi:hypothetical protein